MRHGIEVTSPTKTALDLTTVLGTEASLVVLNHFLHRALTDAKQLKARYDAMKHDPSTLSTRVVLGLSDAAIESVGESRAFFLCWRQGLPRPTAQWEVCDASLQLHGGAGYMNEYLIARLWRDARVTRIFGGTSEIMKEVVSRSL